MAEDDAPEILDVSGEDRDEAVRRAAEELRHGGLVVVPTDTVYGVAADAFSTTGTGRVFAAKRRARSFPLPVLVRSPKQLQGLVTVVPEAADRLMAAYWPGALTIVVQSDPNLMWDLGESQGTVAVRMPFDEVALEVISAVGPLAVTSANLSGQPAATDVEAARDQLGDSVAVYLDDGPRRSTSASTIVDLTREEPHILRAGPLEGEEVIAVATGELDPMEAGLPGTAGDEESTEDDESTEADDEAGTPDEAGTAGRDGTAAEGEASDGDGTAAGDGAREG